MAAVQLSRARTSVVDRPERAPRVLRSGWPVGYVNCSARRMSRNPRWLVEVSTACGIRAAGGSGGSSSGRTGGSRLSSRGAARAPGPVGRCWRPRCRLVGRGRCSRNGAGPVVVCVPVRGPLPDVADHVVEAVAVGGNATDRRGALVAVLGGFWCGKSPCQVLAIHLRRVELVAPRKLRAVQASAGREFPLGLGGQLLAGPDGVGGTSSQATCTTGWSGAARRGLAGPSGAASRRLAPRTTTGRGRRGRYRAVLAVRRRGSGHQQRGVGTGVVGRVRRRWQP